MRPSSVLSLAFIALSLAACPLALEAQTVPVSPSSIVQAAESAISTSGSFSIIPIDSWASGDYDALADEFFGYDTPRTNQMSVSMDETATTTYAGDLFFRKLRLKVGLKVDVDDNFIGKLNRFMGYVNYSGFTLRVQTSRLRGTAYWEGDPVAGMPAQSDFDNPFVSVDLLHYWKDDASMYYGLGYTSYRLPVQLDCLTYDTSRGEVWWAYYGDYNVSFYQPDMAFHIYSVLFGIDTLHGAFAGKGPFSWQGFGLWMWTQDRAGAGLSYISDETKDVIQTAYGKPLWSATQIAMLVDYNLTLGVQWVGDLGRARLALGLGYNVGGQIVVCITPKGPVDAEHVDASPSVYLVHHGPMFTGIVSW
jgi:hypothetical protein